MIKPESEDIFSSEKVIGFDEAIKIISEAKNNNKTVGLCHGQFDLLHPGHIKHFESAGKLCDILLVSVTSDKFVELLKSPGRPVYTDKLRAYSAAAIEFVDFVVISDFKTGIEVIKLLKPSYYIKGPDYVGKVTDTALTAEIEAIRLVGGEIKYTKDPKLSTTDIIKYIKNNLKECDA